VLADAGEIARLRREKGLYITARSLRIWPRAAAVSQGVETRFFRIGE